MTTAAAMDGKPLTVAEAWQVHDWLFEDDRVVFLLEPVGRPRPNGGRTLGCWPLPGLPREL